MDASLLTLVNQGWTHPWLDLLMIGFTTIGLGIIGMMTLMTLTQGARALGWSLLLAQVAALIGTLVFYYVAARTRPDAVRLVMASPLLPSFPSGHAAIAVATTTAWWLHNGWNRRTAVVVALAAGITYSRVYLGHHYPTDAAAGFVWGLGMGAAAHGIVHNWRNLRATIGWLLWPQISFVILVTLMAYLGLIPLFLLTWPYADKVLHLLLFGLLAFWLNLWMPNWAIRMGRWRVPVAVALPFALIAVEEVMQGFSSLRTFDLLDLASDLLGLTLFYLLSLWVAKRITPPVAILSNSAVSGRTL